MYSLTTVLLLTLKACLLVYLYTVEKIRSILQKAIYLKLASLVIL